MSRADGSTPSGRKSGKPRRRAAAAFTAVLAGGVFDIGWQAIKILEDCHYILAG